MNQVGRICRSALIIGRCGNAALPWLSLCLACLAIDSTNLSAAEEPRILTLEGSITGVHDPVVIKEKDTYYLFNTGGSRGGGAGGGSIPVRTSKDMINWTNVGFALEPGLPAWVRTELPNSGNSAWAPDISFFNGEYHLYYAVSSFGSRNSVLGLATTKTLDRSSPDYQWVDQGMVLRSYDTAEHRDDWNAIDPNLVIEGGTNVWLTWGSFWSGIKMKRINYETGKPFPGDTNMISISSRERARPINGSVEAPFIYRHETNWYLFVSFDRCCQGSNSTYNVVVGRSPNITGPYSDKDGKLMTEGGGSLVINSTEGAWRGPGHEAVLREGGQDYLFMHAYPVQGRGSSLQISTMLWDEKGWPRVGKLP